MQNARRWICLQYLVIIDIVSTIFSNSITVKCFPDIVQPLFVDI